MLIVDDNPQQNGRNFNLPVMQSIDQLVYTCDSLKAL